MKKILLLSCCMIFITNIFGQISQFPQIYYSAQGASGQNIRSTPSLTGNTVLAIMTSKIGAESLSGVTLNPYGVQNWIKVCLPGTSGNVTYGYMLCNEFYARINEINNYATVIATTLNIRPSAGNTTQWVTIGSSNATFGQNSIVALTGSTSTISGIVWYQVYLTSNCSQSTGWVSSGSGSSFLTVNSNTTNYRNFGGRVCNNASNCSFLGEIGGAQVNFGTYGSTLSSGEGGGNSGGYFEYKLPINASMNITCTHPNYNVSTPSFYSYTASGHSYNKNFILSNSCSTPISPGNLTITSITSTSISMSWSAVPGSGITYEILKNNTSCSSAFGSSGFTTTATSITITGLNPNTFYFFVVTASNGCGTSGNSNCVFTQTTASSYTISGTITHNGSGLNGVTLTGNPGNYTATTNSSGNYSLTLPGNWNGSVTPSLSNYTFSPASLGYNNLSTNWSGQNYTASNTSAPIINSITFTNKIENHGGVTPLHTLYTGSAYITNNPIKICADGSAATFIKINASSTAGITFRILDGNTQINNPEIYGGLGTPITFGNNIEVQYTHPQYMNLSGLLRQLKLEVLYNDVPINGISFPLHIYRAPLLMVHGLWGNYSSFEKTEEYLISSNTYPGSFRTIITGMGLVPVIDESTNFLTQRADYEFTNAVYFNSNAGQIPLWSKILLNKARQGNYSCGKFDLCGHSMGGVLARLYISNKYGNYKNDVHKLITLNTPHRGTQVANYIDRDAWYPNSLKYTLKNLLGWRTDQGAVEDLRVESDGIRYLNTTQTAYQFNVPTHTISTKDFSLSDPMGIAVQDLLGYAILHDNIYDSELSDLIVPLSSQKTGLSLSTTIPNQFHVGSSQNSTVLTKLKELLNANPLSSSAFSQNGVQPGTLTQPVFNMGQTLGESSVSNDSIFFVTPINNETFSAGSTVNINIQTLGNVSKILFVGGNKNIETKSIDTLSNQLAFTYNIPNTAVGQIYFVAFGGDSLKYRVMDTIKINVSPAATLDSLFSIPQSISIPVGFNMSLALKGLYSDSVLRDLSTLSQVAYSTDSLIVKHLGNSVLSGIGNGNSIITATYQNKSTQINVHVYSDTSLFSAWFSSNKTQICQNDSITFRNESTSIPTSLMWQFAGGSPSTSTTQNPVVSFNTPGPHAVSLIATYPGKIDTLSIPDYITVDPAPTANAGLNNIICTGTPYTLTGASVGGVATNGTWSIVGTTGTMTNNIAQLNLATGTSMPDTVKFTPIPGHQGTVTLKLTTDDPTGPCDSVSSTVVLTVNGYTWYGTDNTNWSNGANWSSCGIPPSGADLTIATTGNNPILPTSLIIGSLTLNSGSILQLGGHTLTINGAINGVGKIKGSSTSNLVFTGAAGILNLDQTNNASRSLNNLTLTNGASASLGDSMNLYGTITLTSASLHLAGKSLTLKSTDINTARIADLTNSILDGASNVTMERFIKLRSPGNGYGTGNNGRAYRLLAPTVNTAGHPTKASMKNNWMEGGMNTAIGTNVDPVPNYGTQITGAGGNINGFDVTQSNASSLYTVINAAVPTYTAVTNTNGSLNALTGYFLYLRGDRSMNMQIPLAPGMPTSSTTLRTTGSLVQGTQNTFTNSLVGSGALNLVTNPYPSPIDWNLVFSASSNITSSYTFWDPNFGTRGGFVTVNTAGIASSGLANRFIQPGQAFFVESNNIGTPAVSIKESHKTAGNNNEVFLTPPPPVEAFRVELYFNELNAYRRVADGIIALFNNIYSAGIDAADAKEVNNWDENIAITRENKHLAIEGRPVITTKDTIQLFMNNMKQQAYEFEFTPSMFTNTNLKAELIDNFNNTRTLLSVTTPTVVNFLITADPASSASDRFKVVFGSFGGPLAVDVITITANKKNTGVKVDWVSKTEKDMDSYELERSLDGSRFIKQNTTTAIGNSNGPVNYSWFDALPMNGNNFYRVKGIDKFGNNRYSSIVKILFGKNVEEIITYPNPVTKGAIKIEFTEMLKGEYNLRLVNMLGQVIFNKTLNHNGGTATHEIYFNKVTTGVYNLEIVKPDKSIWTKKLTIVD